MEDAIEIDILCGIFYYFLELEPPNIHIHARSSFLLPRLVIREVDLGE